MCVNLFLCPIFTDFTTTLVPCQSAKCTTLFKVLASSFRNVSSEAASSQALSRPCLSSMASSSAPLSSKILRMEPFFTLTAMSIADMPLESTAFTSAFFFNSSLTVSLAPALVQPQALCKAVRP